VDEVLGEKAYATLADIPFPVDLVNVFRASEHIPGVVDECLAIKAPAIWIQEDIVHDEAAVYGTAYSLTLGAWIIAVGSAVTCVTRTLAIAKRLHSPA
jgi:predicted CoA-binding protein